MKNTVGPESIVPLALVFGESSSLRPLTEPVMSRPFLAEREEAAEKVQRYIADNLVRAKSARTRRNNKTLSNI